MGIEWVESLQQKIRELKQGLSVLEEQELHLPEREKNPVSGMSEDIDAIQTAALSLPLDEGVLMWTDFGYLLYPIKSYLTDLISFLCVQWAAPTPHQDLQDLLDRMIHQSEQAYSCTCRLLALYRRYLGSQDDPFITVSPDFIASFIQARYGVKGCQVIMRPDQPDGALILYHLHYMRRLIRSLIGWARADTVCIVSDQPLFLEICLTSQSLHLRPEMWQRLIDGIERDHIEFLRDMDGKLEPLTWNEGYGEGVIVRLPWAHPSAADQ